MQFVFSPILSFTSFTYLHSPPFHSQHSTLPTRSRFPITNLKHICSLHLPLPALMLYRACSRGTMGAKRTTLGMWRSFSSVEGGGVETTPSSPPTTTTTPAATHSRPPKMFSDVKRARRLMVELEKDALERREAFLSTFRPPFPEFDVGDAIEVQVARDLESDRPQVVRGTVIGKKKRGLESSFTLINADMDTSYRVTYKVYSPLLRGIRVMRRKHATGGRRRPRRAKLNYLWDRSPGEYRVTRETKEQWETELEARIRRELQARGRTASRRAVHEEKEKLLRTGKGMFKIDSTYDVPDRE